jgi:hypothetical protein
MTMSGPRPHAALRVVVPWSLIGVCTLLACSAASAQTAAHACDGFLLPPRMVNGKAVGPTSCLMQ